MAKVLPVVQNDVTTGWMIFCPACKSGHLFNVAPGKKAVWEFVNKDVEKPTFVASMLVRSGCKVPDHKKGEDCWCTFKARYGKEPGFDCRVCHSHVKDGKIQFLGDCTHELAGQTVDLPDWKTQES